MFCGVGVANASLNNNKLAEPQKSKYPFCYISIFQCGNYVPQLPFRYNAVVRVTKVARIPKA